MKKIFYYCNFPSPYYIGFLNELGKHCELTAVFERGDSSERDSSWKHFSAPNIKNLIIMHGIHTQADMAFCPQIVRYVNKEKYDAYILHDPASPTGMWLIWYMKLRKLPFVLQSEGGFPGDGMTGLKEKYKKALMSGAQLYFSPMSLHREYFLSYGATKEKMRWYPFSSFYKKDLLDKPLSREEKLELRRDLGITEEKVVISVGRIIKSKAFDIMIKACDDFNSDVGVYIISGQPDKELSDLVQRSAYKNIHFIDFMPKENLWRYYRAADLFALPTRGDTWGLFVNEAMANGLPVITTKQCVAGLELIQDDENGYLINIDDIDDLNKKMKKILYDVDLMNEMAAKNIEKIRKFTFEDEVHYTLKGLGFI